MRLRNACLLLTPGAALALLLIVGCDSNPTGPSAPSAPSASSETASAATPPAPGVRPKNKRGERAIGNAPSGAL
jgi:hypothetical protein